jgi:sarcosine oxidase delta subunit
MITHQWGKTHTHTHRKWIKFARDTNKPEITASLSYQRSKEQHDIIQIGS